MSAGGLGALDAVKSYFIDADGVNVGPTAAVGGILALFVISIMVRLIGGGMTPASAAVPSAEPAPRPAPKQRVSPARVVSKPAAAMTAPPGSARDVALEPAAPVSASPVSGSPVSAAPLAPRASVASPAAASVAKTFAPNPAATELTRPAAVSPAERVGPSPSVKPTLRKLPLELEPKPRSAAVRPGAPGRTVRRAVKLAVARRAVVAHVQKAKLAESTESLKFRSPLISPNRRAATSQASSSSSGPRAAVKITAT